MISEPDMKSKDAKRPRRKALLSVRTLARCEDFGLQSGVALRFPPQSKKIYFASPRLCAFALKN
jgi:hypothetical protein